MDEPVISREHIRAMAREAYERGCARDGHGMNPNAPALRDWLAEWDRCQTQALGALLAGGSPP